MADDLTLKISADASGVQKGVNQATSSLDTLAADAAKTSKNLARLGEQKVAPSVTVTVKDQAIAKARADIAKLRDEIARGVVMGADTKAAERRIAELQRSIRALEGRPHVVNVETRTAKASGELSKLGNQINGLNLPIGSLQGGLIAAGAAAVGFAVKTSASMETAKAQLNSVVTDAGQASKVFKEIKEFASATPFEFPDILAATNALAAFGVQGDKLIDTVKGLGEAAAATQVPIQEVSTIYGQMLARGKLTAEDAIQFTGRGVKLYDALGVALGVTAEQAKELQEQGKIGRQEIEKLPAAFQKLYGGSIAAQADTFNGKLSTLNDTVKEVAQSFGDELVPTLKQFMDIINNARLPEFSAGAAQGLAELNKFSFLSIWNEFRKGPDQIKGVTGEIKRAGEAANTAAAPTKDLATAYKDAASNLDDLLGKLDVFNERGRSAEEATIAYQRAIDDANAALKENGKTIDANTEKGRTNREALIEVANTIGEMTNKRLADSQQSGESTTKILADYAAQREALIQQATKFTGSRRAAEAYVNKLLETPKQIKTEVKVTGVDKAKSEVDELTKKRELEIQVQIRLNRAQLNRVQKELARYGAGAAPFSLPPTPTPPPVPSGHSLQVGPPTPPNNVASRGQPPQASVAGVVPQGTVGGLPVNFGLATAAPQVIISVNDKRLADLIEIAVRDALSGELRVLSSRQVVQT